MVPKALVLAALAASAVANPTPTPQHAKRFAPGRCGIHIHDDASIVIRDSQKLKVTFYDDGENWFYTSPLTDATDKDKVEIKPDDFDEPLKFIRLEEGKGELKGWHIYYEEQDWTTNDVPQCKAGAMADATSEGSDGRRQRDYDCSFDC